MLDRAAWNAVDEYGQFLDRVAATTGGRSEPDGPATLAFEGPPARGLRDLWRLFVLLAGLLLPIDIALRRLG